MSLILIASNLTSKHPTFDQFSLKVHKNY